MAYDWIQRIPAHHPQARFAHGMAWDGTKVVLFGGLNPGVDLYGDTWRWDASDWTEESPAHSPVARQYPGMAYDIANDRVVLFGGDDDVGGIFGDTWVWDGTDWTQLSPAHSPPARSRAGMAYDETRSKVVLFSGIDIGGFGINDTWTWDGTDWTQELPAHTPYDGGESGQQLGCMAWDPTNHVVVHTPNFSGGGFFAVQGTWVWDGTDWTEHTPAHSPTGIENPGFANWRVGGKPLSFAGRLGGLPDSLTNGTWTWSGTDWAQIVPAHSPGARGDLALAYDEAHRQVLLFGGEGFGALGDTWIYADAGPFTLHLETGNR